MASQRQSTSPADETSEDGLGRRADGEDLFGVRLRYERERRGMTQADVAQLLDRQFAIKLHPSAIAKMEMRDVERPRAIRLNEATAVASLFGMSLDDMLEPPDDAFNEAAELAERWAGALREAERLRDVFLAKLRSLGPLMVADSAGPRQTQRRIASALDETTDLEQQIVRRFDEAEVALTTAFPDLRDKPRPNGVKATLVEDADGRAHFVLETSEGHKFTSDLYESSHEAHLARRRMLEVLRTRWFPAAPEEVPESSSEGDKA